MNLDAIVSASVFDKDYEMALVYCFDKSKNYCFSLSRFPDEDLIEVMVHDQLNHKVYDLSVHLKDSTLTVNLAKETAKKLDNITTYIIELTNIDTLGEASLHDSLSKIFEGKRGLQIANRLDQGSNSVFDQSI